MTRQEIIAGFHKLYLENIEKETRRRGRVGASKGGGIAIDALKKIHDDTIADYVESFLRPPAMFGGAASKKSLARTVFGALSPRKGITT